jgi:hypothetical protein
MLQLIIKNCLDQLVLRRDNRHDIIAIFILLITGDIFSFFHVQVSGDFRQKDGECYHNDTPGVVDDVPNTRSVLLHPDKLWTQSNGYALKDSLRSQHKLIQRPIELHPLLTIGIIQNDTLGPVHIIDTIDVHVLNLQYFLNEIIPDEVNLSYLDLYIGD